MTLHDITGIHDPYLPAAMDLYQNSFPDRECAPFSWWFTFWNDLDNPAADLPKSFFTVALSDDGAVAGIAVYEILPRDPNTREAVGYLSYLATAAERRGAGLGAELFGAVRARCIARSCEAVVWEVEDPDEVAQSQGEEDALLARRRIGFYRRCGGRLLGGVHYELDLHRPGLSPFPMQIMIAAAPSDTALSPEDALRLANLALSSEGETASAVQQTGPLTME